MKIKNIGACVSAVALLGGAAHAEISDNAVKIGVMNDQSGLYADLAGQGSVEAARMAGSLAFERLPLVALYHAFKYAFPDRTSELIERADVIERTRLHDFLEPRSCWLSTHPYPPDLAELRRSLSPLWETSA